MGGMVTNYGTDEQLVTQSRDRDLSWFEDEIACTLLMQLAKPAECSMLDKLVSHYVSPQYQKNRTLCAWYGIARSVARWIQDSEKARPQLPAVIQPQRH